MTAPETAQPSLLAKWMREEVFKCLHCGSVRLALSAQGVACGACESTWPVRNEVPDFFNQYTGSCAPAGHERALRGGDADLVDTLLRVLDLEGDDSVRARVQEIVERSRMLSCDNPALSAEIRDLADRFAPTPVGAPLPPQDPLANQDARIDYVRHYFGECYPAGASFSANVRIRNLGAHPWSSRTEVPRTLSVSWQGPAGARQNAGEFSFPVDVAPGACITLPLRLIAPVRAGPWHISVGLADGGRRAAGAQCLDILVVVDKVSVWRKITATLPWLDAPVLQVLNRKSLDYGADHALGVQIIGDWVRESGRSGLRLLEVGSGTHPQTAWLPDLEVLAVDISTPMLELGSLYFRQRFVERLGFVCADAFDPPFMPGQFDGIAIFSALHHFPEPDSLLLALARLLRPGGVIFVMCEPVGNSLDGAETVRDLAKGINEQVFSLDEYQRIFTRAGLTPQSLRVDGGSLKTVLERR